MKEGYEKYLITAGGRIKCGRCQAQSSRTKKQCAKPALHSKNVCGHHGGQSTGPKSKEGKDAIRRAHWKHGNQTKAAKAHRSEKSLMFLMLEELGHHAHLFTPNSQKTRGRKPSGFEKLDLNESDQLAKAIELSMPKLK
jgi:hypothetical protein